MTAPVAPTPALESPRVRYTCAAFVFVAALALYSHTLAPTVTLVDSGELTMAARTLGVAHPPGFPLYVLLAHLITLIPIGNVAVRVNFASALFAALAAAMLTLAVAEALLTRPQRKLQRDHPPKKSARGKRAKKVQPTIDEPDAPEAVEQPGLLGTIIAVLPCLAAGLVFAFSRTLWAYATIAEVYTLNTLLLTVIFFLMFRWRRLILNAATRARGDMASPHDAWLYLAAFIFGLAMGVHHVTIAVTLPALAVLVFTTAGFEFFRSRRLLKAALFAIAGLSIYIYLPLAAMRSPVMNWGNPRTLDSFWAHVSGRQYQIFLTSSLKIIASQFKGFFGYAWREFNPVWLPLGLTFAVAGLVAAFKRHRAAFLFLVLVIVFDLAYALSYKIDEDKDAYYLPTFTALAIATGFGIAWLIRRARTLRLPAQPAMISALLIAALAPVAALIGNYAYNNRGQYYLAQDYVENIESTIEPGGMLFTSDWEVYSPMWYLREIEHQRSDVVAIDINQLRRSWYFDYLRRAYPEVMDGAREQVEAFLEDLRHYEQDPDLYNRDLTLNGRINTRFYDMLNTLATNHLRTAPVYVTEDIATNFQGQDSEFTKSLDKNYSFVPQGLIFQLMGKGAYHAPVSPLLATRGLADGSIKFADDDVVALKVMPVYLRMLVNRGRYLAVYGRYDQAMEAFNAALALKPDFKYAQQSLNEAQAAQRKQEAAKKP
jgi:tetratricopeptide (TPR) repeat protein